MTNLDRCSVPCTLAIALLVAGAAPTRDATATPGTSPEATPPPAAQEPTVRLGPEVLAGQPGAGMMFIEPHLAVHPEDPDLLIGAAYETNHDYSLGGCVVFRSQDGGTTWSEQRLEGQECPDVWVNMAGDRAILTALGDHDDLVLDRPQLIAFFSDDRGAAWSRVPLSLGSGFDGPRSALAPDGTFWVTAGQGGLGPAGEPRSGLFLGRVPPATPHVYVQARLVPTTLNQVADGAAVLSDGTLVMTFQDYQRPVGGAGRAFRGRAGAVQTRRSWALRSTDHGESFSPLILVTEACAARPTFLAIDTGAGLSRDRLYHVCSGDDLNSVVVVSSSTGGVEWSDSVRVETPSEETFTRMYPQIAVNAAGVVGVAWMDKRDDTEGTCYAPYFAASIDGGVSFTTPIRVAEEMSCPDLENLGRAGGRFRTGGDYFGLVGTEAAFQVLWPDARDGVFALRTVRVTVEGAFHPTATEGIGSDG